MGIKLNYLKAIVIVHGKSELHIFNFIRSKLRLKIEPVSKKKGESSIQITSVMKILNNTVFKNQQSFLQKYPDVEWDFDNKKINKSFRIFIIMDTDDCTLKEKESFINKSMFLKHWAYEYITPIYNSPKLEPVLKSAGIKCEKKKDYIKIFPSNDRYKQHDRDHIDLENFMNKLKLCKNTNFDEFIKFCLDLRDK